MKNRIVRFCQSRFYIELYCRDTNLSMVHMSEEVFAFRWMTALNAEILDNRNDVQMMKADIDRGRLGIDSFVVLRAEIKLKTKFGNRVFQMNSMLEEMLLEVLRDDVVINHCNYTENTQAMQQPRQTGQEEDDKYLRENFFH